MAEVGTQHARTDGHDTVLVVDLDAWPLSLDPFHVVDFNQALVLDALVDPLTRDLADGPGTAPSALAALTPADGDRVWLLRPASGQCWDDGSPVRPQEIAAGVHRAWGPTCLPLPAAYDPEGTGSPATTRVVPDPADGTPVVELRSALPLPYLPQLLAFPGAAPVRETPDGGWRASGPFRPVRADRARGRIELRRKPSRRTGPGTPERLAFQVHADRTDAFAALADGRLDLSVNTGLTPDEFTAAAARPGATVRGLSMACQLWVRPGLDSPLATPAGRRAFSAGFDRRAASALLRQAALPLWRYSDLWEPPGSGRGGDSRPTASRSPRATGPARRTHPEPCRLPAQRRRRRPRRGGPPRALRPPRTAAPAVVRTLRAGRRHARLRAAVRHQSGPAGPCGGLPHRLPQHRRAGPRPQVRRAGRGRGAGPGAARGRRAGRGAGLAGSGGDGARPRAGGAAVPGQQRHPDRTALPRARRGRHRHRAPGRPDPYRRARPPPLKGRTV
ncbi:ABC transporter substrate-binding protein [Streptomyces sp. NPDC021356]|uniref:ABC transporter substrate-binding protein n=1 Tax=Streptomyces sp. NPDC021356 TaxID=3154900 RepID=UPI0033DDBEE3